MSRRKVSPEAQIIALFTGLSDESKRMVMFGLNAITMNESPKSPAPAAAKKSSPKRAAPPLIPNTVDGTDDASNAGPKCVATVPGLDVPCGNKQDNGIHDPNGGYGGYHEFESPKSKKASPQK